MSHRLGDPYSGFVVRTKAQHPLFQPVQGLYTELVVQRPSYDTFVFVFELNLIISHVIYMFYFIGGQSFTTNVILHFLC